MKAIRDDPPMPEEIANGFYPEFENRWYKAEVSARILMVVLVAGCVLGLLGPGLFSNHHKSNADNSISVDFDRVIRFGAPTLIKIDTKVPDGGDKVAVTMARNLVDALGLEKITPNPASWQAGQDSIRITFPVVPGQPRVFIRLSGSPSFRGLDTFFVRLDAGENISWSQLSIP